MKQHKIALITGASGQDSLLLSEYLMKHQGYIVFATTRRAARPQSKHVIKLQELYPKQYNLIPGDVTDYASIWKALQVANPTEFYNLAAQSHVGNSFHEPMATLDITGKGVLNCLTAIRDFDPEIRFYQASSSEQFGGTKSVEGNWLDSGTLKNGLQYALIDESTPFAPRSPYACAKVYGHNITSNYREAYGIHASCGILFNHESVYRKPEFVTRKVTIAVNEIFLGLRNKLKLGTLNFARDWGWAGDYVRAMHSMLQQDRPGDYIIATGKAYTGEELLETAFNVYNLNWREYIELDDEFARPSDVKVLVGSAKKAQEKLGFTHTVSFEQMIKQMIDYDYNELVEYGEIHE